MTKGRFLNKFSRRFVVSGLLAAPVAAGLGVPRAQAATAAVYIKDGVAWNGYDPVAYFTAGVPVPGRQDLEFDHNGVTVLFSNEDNRDLFADDPARYAPQYGGYCAYALSQGQIVPTVPAAWTIHEGKLFLNASLQNRDLWLADIAGHIAQADTFWPDVLSG
ncbi:YHS domain-containing (seleno)protein [Aliiroseovarius sediminis]|uniref:YHS domain-containing (seleno)protein n=1 Tax=Aliiroseovarius sediminis TaxID=2925839 RepID=UPI001F597719|nr:YHS domain-containing (seleno)protein [Aliiroseovarius sediminis]MCI2394490.1 YHS domain protein [Aliiroseovarius sediminis]